MIKSKEELKYYLECDKVALSISKRKMPLVKSAKDLIWEYEQTLRKTEYYVNCTSNPILKAMYRLRLSRLGLRLGFSLPLNAFGPGLSIAHPGTIVVNSNCRIGKNCRIQTGVTLGATNGDANAPILGDNIFLGDGCKLIGNIRIADDVCIGANAVVTKDITEKGTTWGGVPAKKISENNSHSNLVLATEFVDGVK